MAESTLATLPGAPPERAPHREASADPVPPTALKGPKDLSVETLRGVAIILVVAGHVIGSGADGGLRVPDDSVYRYMYACLKYVQLSLFTVVTGFVYALRPVARGAIGRFIGGKAQRILLPFFTVMTIMYLARVFAPGVNYRANINDIWKIYIFGRDHFWFLQAIFLCFCAVALIDALKVMQTLVQWTLWMCAAIAVNLHAPRTEWFNIDGFEYLIPYFIFGCGVFRFRKELFQPAIVWPVGLLCVGGLALQQYYWFAEGVRHFGRGGPLAMVVGLSLSLSLFALRPTNRGLVWIGQYSYGIFLFHVFGTAGSRWFLMRMGIHDLAVLFVAGLSAGLVFPILLQEYVIRGRVPRMLLLGMK